MFLFLPRYDEFGFRVEEEDGPEHCSSKLLSIPFIESPRYVILAMDKFKTI